MIGRRISLWVLGTQDLEMIEIEQNYLVPDLQTAVVKTAIGRLQSFLGVVAP